MLGKSAPCQRNHRPIGRCYGVIVARLATQDRGAVTYRWL